MRLPRFIRSSTLLTAAALCGSAAVTSTPAQAAGLLIADGGFGGVLEIQEHDVKVVVNNGVAVTTVNQVFKNTENRQVEALYTFPVPRGASVSNFSMWINGKEMVGEVVEKKRAREIYESYKVTRRDPGLLEQVDYRTFDMRVFPIGPKAEQRVQVTYYQELDFDHNRATYVYPLATSTRPGVNSRTTGKFALSIDCRSAVPISDLSSPSHPDSFAVAKHDPNYRQASFEVRGGDLSRDVVVAVETSRPQTGVDLITTKPPGEDGYFSLTLTAGEELAASVKSMDYVFVMDISGSMNDDGKLTTSRQAVGTFIQSLSPQERFDVLAFNVDSTVLFSGLTAADEGAKARATQFLASQQARGGTVLHRAMTAAYKYASPDRPLNVVVLSDGLADASERGELTRMIAQRPQGTRVFAVGVGNDVNRGLLEQLAEDSGGLAAFVSRDDDWAKQADAFRRKLTRPVATDVAIHIAGVDAYDLQPAKLPNLYYGMPVRLYGRYRGEGTARVTVNASINGASVRPTVAMDFSGSDDANPEIERMWALKKVDGLLKSADARDGRSAVVDEIVRLGEGYSIVTEYTSFLVLENEAEYQRWKLDRRNVLRVGRDRLAQQKTADLLRSLQDRSAADLGPAGLERQKPVMHPTVAAAPAAPPASYSAGQPTRQPVADSPRSNDTGKSRNFRFFGGGGGGGGGGGAIDPLSGVALVTAGGAACWMLRRRTAAK